MEWEGHDARKFPLTESPQSMKFRKSMARVWLTIQVLREEIPLLRHPLARLQLEFFHILMRLRWAIRRFRRDDE